MKDMGPVAHFGSKDLPLKYREELDNIMSTMRAAHKDKADEMESLVRFITALKALMATFIRCTYIREEVNEEALKEVTAQLAGTLTGSYTEALGLTDADFIAAGNTTTAMDQVVSYFEAELNKKKKK